MLTIVICILQTNWVQDAESRFFFLLFYLELYLNGWLIIKLSLMSLCCPDNRYSGRKALASHSRSANVYCVFVNFVRVFLQMNCFFRLGRSLSVNAVSLPLVLFFYLVVYLTCVQLAAFKILSAFCHWREMLDKCRVQNTRVLLEWLCAPPSWFSLYGLSRPHVQRGHDVKCFNWRVTIVFHPLFIFCFPCSLPISLVINRNSLWQTASAHILFDVVRRA